MNMGKWYFAKAKGIEIKGFNNIVGSFIDSPVKSLAKEICQNSLDTKMGNERKSSWPKTIKVSFDEYWIKAEDFDGYDELYSVMKEEYEFALSNYKNDDTVANFYKNAIKCLTEDKIKCLRISDFNTPGLTGSDKIISPWSNLVKNIGVSDKPDGSGGSKGQGKLAAFACSNIYTVFYSTNSVDNCRISEGVARLSGYMLSNGDTTTGTGYYEDNNLPIKNDLKLLKGYKRNDNEYGTDVIIVGFRNDFENWQEQLIASIIDNFFVSIINNDLEVNINNGEHLLNSCTIDSYINHETIRKLVNECTIKYYEVLMAPQEKIIVGKHSMFEENDLELILKVDDTDDGLINSVAAVRLTGMKILDLDHLPRLGIYHGVLFLKGKKINDYFRKLENETHDKWSSGGAVGYVAEAENKIEELKNFVRKTIKDNLAITIQKEMDAEGVGEFLPDEDASESNKNGENNESIENERVANIKITEKPIKPSKTEMSQEIDNKNDNPNDVELDENGNIILPQPPKPTPPDPPIPNPNPKPVDKYIEISRRLTIKKLKVIGNSDIYHIILSFENDEPIVKVQVFIYGENNNEAVNITKLKIAKKGIIRSNIKYEYKNNELLIYNVSAKDEYHLDIKLDTDETWSLEVRAYGNQ